MGCRIKITGDVQLIQDTSGERLKYETADGVRVAIQHEGTELWAARITQDDYGAKTPTGVDAIGRQEG
jgi:hypothetical protein